MALSRSYHAMHDTALTTLILNPEAMQTVDRRAGDGGIDMWRMMLNAGCAVAAKALSAYPEAVHFVVLAGPGNNGGDGYVAAHQLASSGARVSVFHLGEVAMGGDAALARNLWAKEAQALEHYRPEPGDVVIDALFGAGLSRQMPEDARILASSVADAAVPVIAVDLPSGIDGRTGRPLGGAFRADYTVTFMCHKPAHLLLPGRDYCGDVSIVDIGIPARYVTEQQHGLHINSPMLWRDKLPNPTHSSHKYSRGHLAVFGGPTGTTGAARLAATAALKAGAGAITLLAPQNALADASAHLTAVMIREENAENTGRFEEDQRVTACVIGPGFGDFARARELVAVLKSKRIVLDADGISAFSKTPTELFDQLSQSPDRLVMTPHHGEFERIFLDIAADRSLSKVEQALAAAARSNATVVYKGADTVIASPDGRALINTNAPPWLATAGSGDVLAGAIGALLAQGMPTHEAAAAGVWLHGKTGANLGEGLTAETLAEEISSALFSVE